MTFSLGFLVILVFIIFPGLLYRRLYFYGQFSKEFNSSNLVTLLAISSIPGIINLLMDLYIYDHFIEQVSFEQIIDSFKDLNNPKHRYNSPEDVTIKEQISSHVIPFIGFLYTTTVFSGSLTGRFIRKSKLDTRFKLLRFKNNWFYLFYGQPTGFKKMEHLKVKNKKHVFTKADILIDANNKTHLYSGIVEDYELSDKNTQVLSKVMLRNAERYSIKDEKRVRVPIPGNLLVVDCSSMKNINLTYVYEEVKSLGESLLESKLPGVVSRIMAYITLLLIPIFIFQFKFIKWELYELYFNWSWYEKILAYFVTIQAIGILNPFNEDKGVYSLVTRQVLIMKIAIFCLLTLILWLLI